MRIASLAAQLLLILTLTACGGGSGGGSSEPVSTNLAPTFSGATELNILEGLEDVATLTASDPEGSAVSFSLAEGDDSQYFALSSSGRLRFNSPRDFESPQDSNQDNSYNIAVNASDGLNSRTRNYSVKVTNALEGRVIAAPLSASTVFIDNNANLQLDADEISVLSDEYGYFSIAAPEVTCQAIEGCSPIVVAVGGTDIATGKVLDNLLLVAEALLNETFAITPLSSILVGSANPQAILDALGLTVSADELLLIDPWLSTESSDPGAALLLSVNQQLALLMQSAASLLTSNSTIDISEVNLALVAELETLLSDSQFDLADSQSLQTLLQNSVERLQIEALINAQMSAAVALQVGQINAILADAEIDILSSLVAEILTLAQDDLQSAIEQLATEVVSLEQFSVWLDIDSLFTEIELPALLADLDNDDIPDLLDLDDDGDGVYDFIDAFPRDSSETLDTDGDGVGNNTDSDDDNDGVADALDQFPTDASLTPPTAVITASASTGYIYQRISFDASSSLAGYQNDTITSYEWDFGDGTSATGVSASHVFNKAGTYQVSLSLENSDQLTASTSLDVVAKGLGEFSVAGTISVPEVLAIDCDTNDSGATVVPNNSIGTAQILVNPSTVAGYVNSANEGPNYDANGQSAELGDVDDYYRIDALGGEFISLTYADPDSTDLDLYLLDSNGEPAAASLGTSGYESLKIPSQPGIYYLQVTIWDVGASKYILELGLEEGIVTASADHSWSTNVDFAIGDIIVKEQSQFRSSATSSKGSLLTADKTSAKQRRNSGAGTSLYRYGDDIEGLAGRFDTVRKSPGVSRLLNQRAVKSSAMTKVDEKTQRTRLKIATLLAAKELRADASVLYAEPNYRRRKLDTLPNDRYYSDQDHYRSINLPAAWDITTGDADIKVAVIDSGIYEAHPDISARLSNDGYDFIADEDNSGDGDGMDSDANDPGDGLDNLFCPNSDYEISEFHGTHVAGTVGAESNNITGVAGVTWAGEIMNLRVLGCDGGSDFDIANAILYAAGLPNESGIIVADPADIINMSLGGGGYGETLRQAVTDARAAGVIIIAAAGNESLSAATYPASYDGVVSVSATTDNNALASYSNYGATIDLAAPGDDVLSAAAELVNGFVEPIYVYSSGTSMATPHVAGTVALMKAIYTDMSPEDFDAVLISGNISTDIGTAGRDNKFGFGLIDAEKAVDFAQQLRDGLAIPTTPLLSLSSNYLNYGSQLSSLSVLAFNSGNAAVQISAVVAADSYVSVSASGSDDGLGQYDIAIDRTGLAPGTYTSTVVIRSNGGDQTLELIFTIAVPGQVRYGDAGNIYVKAANVDTDERVIVAIDGTENGSYQYAIPLPAAGTYTISAGTDPDNDGSICADAEACGRYTNVGSSKELVVDEGLEQIDFALDYIMPAESGSSIGESISTEMISTEMKGLP